MSPWPNHIDISVCPVPWSGCFFRSSWEHSASSAGMCLEFPTRRAGRGCRKEESMHSGVTGWLAPLLTVSGCEHQSLPFELFPGLPVVLPFHNHFNFHTGGTGNDILVRSTLDCTEVYSQAGSEYVYIVSLYYFSLPGCLVPKETREPLTRELTSCKVVISL